MTDRSPNTDHAGERVQSFLYDTTQQGNTYATGNQSLQSRAERVKRTIQGVERIFPNLSSAREEAQRGQPGTPPQSITNTVGQEYTHSDCTISDLNGVGQQFQGYSRQ